MRVLYLDCPYGIDEHRLLAAVLSATRYVPADIATTLTEAAGFAITITVSPIPVGDSLGRLAVTVTAEHGLSDEPSLRRLLEKLPISERLRDALMEVFWNLQANAVQWLPSPAQPRPPGTITAADYFAVAAAAMVLERFDVKEIWVSPIPLGPSALGGNHPPQIEGVAALLTTELQVTTAKDPIHPPGLASLNFLSIIACPGLLPAMRLDYVGCGTLDGEDTRPSAVQALIGDTTSAPEAGQVAVLETNIDDMPAQVLDYVMARLFEQGALDVYFTPIQMKKNRPAVMVSVLCQRERIEQCVDILMRETTTLGVRITFADRRCLERRMLDVETPYGTVPVKAALLGDRIRSVTPEYDVCSRLAAAHAMPLRAVQDAATTAAWTHLRSEGWKAITD